MKSEDIKKKIESVREKKYELTNLKSKEIKKAFKTIEDRYKERFKAYSARIEELENALDSALVKEAYQRNDGQYPVGTRLAEWEFKYVTDEKTKTAKRILQKTGRIGVVEVYHRGCSTFGMWERYKPHVPGAYIIRILKKSGAISLKAAHLPNEAWLPEGETMKIKKA